VQGVNGGVASLVAVPAEFGININHRFQPGKRIEDVRRIFEELLGWKADYEVVDYTPSGPVELGNPLLRRLIETGLELRPKQAWTDVAPLRRAQGGGGELRVGGLPAQAHQEA